MGLRRKEVSRAADFNPQSAIRLQRAKRGQAFPSAIDSLTQRQPVGEALRQSGGDDFILRGPDVVLDAAELHELLVRRKEHIRRVPVAVARLADAAAVDEVFLPRL